MLVYQRVIKRGLLENLPVAVNDGFPSHVRKHRRATENLRSVKQLPQLLDLSDFPLCIFRLMSSYVVLCPLFILLGLENPSPSLGRGSFLHGLRQGNYIYSTRQNYGKTVSIYRRRLSMIEKLRIVFFP